MENLPSKQANPLVPVLFESIAEEVRVPFEPLTLLRQPGPYARLLGLEVGQAQAPHVEFLFRLLTGHDSHQAYLRREIGPQYKNLENLVRGRHRLTETTLTVLSSLLGVSVEDLVRCQGAAPDGPLVPGILVAFELAEAVPSKLSSLLFSTDVPCPCCGTNVLHDAKAWWRQHAAALGEAEWRFVERMLNAVLGAFLIRALLGPTKDGEDRAWLATIDALADPARHPMGQWLAEGQRLLGCETLADLARQMHLMGDQGEAFSQPRLKKWSSGQDPMPPAMAGAMIKACNDPEWTWWRLAFARSFAMLTEFVMAASPDGLSRKDAQQIVHSRYLAIYNKYNIVARLFIRRLADRINSTTGAEN